MKIYKLSKKQEGDLNEFGETLSSWYTAETARETKDPDLLREIVEQGWVHVISYYALKNPNCPKDLLVSTIQMDYDRGLSSAAAENPNCPPEALVEILKRGKNDIVSEYAAGNINCPPEILVEILKREENNGVSVSAANNPNCPPRAKIEWMRSVGKIGVEDSNKHIVEYDSKDNQPDEDLEKLKSLISKGSMKIYRIAKSKSKEYLSSEERKQIKELFGNDLECSFAKDKDGYYCHTHRARSKSYKNIKDIPKSEVDFIGSTG